MVDTETTSEETTEESTSIESSDEVVMEELSVEEETEEITSNEESSEETLLAGKYRSVEDLEHAYKESNSEARLMATRLNSVEEELKQMKMTPEEKAQADQNRQFVKSNDLMTKQEFIQMQKDEREASVLIKAGATDSQIARVKKVANYGDYAKMSLTEIYKDFYGPVLKKKPSQSIGQKPRLKTVKNNAYTRAEISAMSREDRRKNHADILARGVKS